MCYNGHPKQLLALPCVTLGSGRIIKSECDVAEASLFIKSKHVTSIFYLWCTLKDKVYNNNPHTECNLKGTFRTVFSVMPAEF
jgi:hypothetical protein